MRINATNTPGETLRSMLSLLVFAIKGSSILGSYFREIVSRRKKKGHQRMRDKGHQRMRDKTNHILNIPTLPCVMKLVTIHKEVSSDE
jgi:hypothetical protein